MDSATFGTLLRRPFREIDALPARDRDEIARRAAAAEQSPEGQAILRALGGFPLSRRMALSFRGRLRATGRKIQMSLARPGKMPPRRLVLAELIRRQLPEGLSPVEAQLAVQVAARHASPSVLAWVGDQIAGMGR